MIIIFNLMLLYELDIITSIKTMLITHLKIFDFDTCACIYTCISVHTVLYISQTCRYQLFALYNCM